MGYSQQPLQECNGGKLKWKTRGNMLKVLFQNTYVSIVVCSVWSEENDTHSMLLLQDWLLCQRYHIRKKKQGYETPTPSVSKIKRTKCEKIDRYDSNLHISTILQNENIRASKPTDPCTTHYSSRLVPGGEFNNSNIGKPQIIEWKCAIQE